jgi:hypothetical protein
MGGRDRRERGSERGAKVEPYVREMRDESERTNAVYMRV